MLKNPTPWQIAILSAFLILVAGLSTIALVFVWDWNIPVWIKYLLWSVLFFLVTFQIIGFYLERYIYRKIKLIYKTIRKEKLAPEEKSRAVDIRGNIIGEVDKEVAEWAETQRREIERYKSWEEYRRNYLGDISHELKTPIFNIQGYLESLIDGGLYDAKVNLTFLKKASNNVDRLLTIVQDLETISRLESGALILEMTVFDIKELVREVMEDLEIKASRKQITLEFKDKAAQSYKVQADREKIRQVLINLIHNSIKYGVQNGRTRVGFYDMDRTVLVEVADNGIGIPKQHLSHIFDRFYRVDKSRSREQGGSGLGLSIVKHIIEAHHQTINVRSTPNVGSTFGFTLEKG